MKKPRVRKAKPSLVGAFDALAGMPDDFLSDERQDDPRQEREALDDLADETRKPRRQVARRGNPK